MKKYNLVLILAFLISISCYNLKAQGFVKGALIQYKGKDGKMTQGKFVEFKSYNKVLKIDDAMKIRSTEGKDVDVLFKDFIKLDGGKDVGNNTCNYIFTRHDNKSFTGGINCYYFSVIIADKDGFGQGTFNLRDIVPLSVVSSSPAGATGSTINCPHCGKTIKIEAHK
jgi:hypothetical protein